MDYDAVLHAVETAVKNAGGETSYQEFQDSLPPTVQLTLPRHLNEMRVVGDIELSVRFDVETLTTDLFISVPSGGGV